MIRIRGATEADVPAVYRIWRAAARPSEASAPAADVVMALFRHELAAGHLWVASDGDRLAAYAGLLVRDGVAFLADLFVAPDVQSHGIGAALLRRALAVQAAVHCTMASGDPRALALYARAGMGPRWPHFRLSARPPLRLDLPDDGVAAVAADPADPALVAWDAKVAGRRRPEDHAYWRRALRAVPLWCRRAGATVGYGYVWQASLAASDAPVVGLGPLGAGERAHAVACAAAALRWIGGESGLEATRYDVAVPAAHPALAALLRAGFHIRDVEIFCCSHDDLFLDPRTYLASSGLEGTSIF